MDFLKQNVFVAVCLGVAVATLGAVGGVFFTNSPAAAEKSYQALVGKVKAPGNLKSKGDIAEVAGTDAKRQQQLLEVEKAVLDRAVRPGEQAVYLAHWGTEPQTAVVNVAAKSLTLKSGPPSPGVGFPREQMVSALVQRPAGPPVCGLIQVDADGTEENLRKWRENCKSIRTAGFVLLPKTLHGRSFAFDRSIEKDNPEEFRKTYEAWPAKVRAALGAIEPDKEIVDKLRAAYVAYREAVAANIRDIELWHSTKREIVRGDQPKSKPEYRRDLFLLNGPEATPADMVRRFVARTGLTYWSESCLDREKWITNPIKVDPNPGQMFCANVRVSITDDVLAAVHAVNTPPARTERGRQAPLPLTKDELAKEKWADARKSWEDSLEKAAAAKAAAAAAAAAAAGMGGTPMAGGFPKEPPKEIAEPEAFKSIRERFGNAPGGKDSPLHHGSAPRQGVLGSDIKILERVQFWAVKLNNPDVDWLFQPPTEPLVVGSAAPAAGEAPAAKPDPKAKADPKAAAAPPPAAEEKAGEPRAFFRTIKRPKNEEVEKFRLSALVLAKDAKELRFGAPGLSVTERGSANDYLTVQFGVRVIATQRGIDAFIRQMESRRFYTLTRPPDLAEVRRNRFPDHDFGPDPVLDAMMYFEGVIYIQTFRKVFNPAELGGEGPKEVAANLMPAELWDYFVSGK